ncbi:hypothetical protein PNEG_02924 [Pneumocystis murina B123]|uniref:Importin N-terminal domain-containing protein n=1 Tax=Pneumocystis murina (strain B123) TaxID=1069680 RepID=M7NNQ6_PNEMU|nr:hypothetical protein PNEG_02924 [Pneumocystis murina B123]EMR08751.1 hypothetical protein PNEG_02924 [Pneumocystis murina B123]
MAEELHIEELVNRIYSSENASNLKLIDETHRILEKLQGSERSLEYANKCMQSSNLNVQFFGALTFYVKINLYWSSLKEHEVVSLLYNLLNWVKIYINGPSIVIKKLISSLSIFALKTVPMLWNRPIYCIMMLLKSDEKIELANIIATSDINQMFSLNCKQKRVLVLFLLFFLEEIEKSDIVPSRRLQLYQSIQDSSKDIGLLLKHCFEISRNNNESIELICDAIRCFQVCVFYSWDSNFTLQSILFASNDIFESVISCLLYKETFLVAAETLDEIINHSPKLLSGKLMNRIQEIVWDYWKNINFMKNFDENDGFDQYVIMLSRLIISLCEANIESIFYHLDNENSKIFIEIMLSLLGLPVFAVFQEDISILTLEFFTLFIEMFIDPSHQEKITRDIIIYGKDIAEKVLENCLIKLKWPPSNLLKDWPKDICDKFVVYRKDIGDLLETIFSFLQARLIEKLADLLEQSLIEPLNWEDIEAIIFSLTYISEIYPEEQSESDKYMLRIFDSSFFSVLSLSSQTLVKHTALKFSGSYGTFIKRYPSVIPCVLTFLFNSLEDIELSYISSKSIYKIFSDCRSLITKELSTFLYVFKTMSDTLTFSFDVKQKIFAAISCVIQSLPDNEQIVPLDILIQKIIEDLKLAQSLKFKDFDKSTHLALSCANCLVSIGKSMTSPHLVDTDNSNKHISNSADLINKIILQQRLMEIFIIIEEICNCSEDAIQSICDVLKSGFLEYFFGSFLNIEIIICYLFERFKLYGYSCLISSASYLVAHKKSYNIADNADILKSTLYEFVSLFILFLKKNEISNAPDVLHEFFDFLKIYIYHNIDIFINIQPSGIFDSLMTLIINSLSSEDNLIQKDAINFLIDFIVFCPNNEEEHNLILNVILRYGIFIVREVVINIGGKSSKNFLVYFSDLLYKLSLKIPRNTRDWFLEVINEEGFPSFNLNKAYMIDFINRFLRIRSSQKAKELIKEFWLRAQNMESA